MLLIDKSSDMIEALIGKKAFIDSQNWLENTPFIIASSLGNVDSVKALIKGKANYDHMNKNGNSALSLASKRKYYRERI